MVHTVSRRPIALLVASALLVLMVVASTPYAQAATQSSYGSARQSVGHSNAGGSSNVDKLLEKMRELIRQVNELKSQVKDLSKGGTASSTKPGNGWGGWHDRDNCAYLLNAKDHGRGSRGEDVRAMQKYLREEGDLDDDSVTGYFGEKTERALKRWQEREGIVATGTASTTGHGWFGKKSREFMKRRCEDGRGDFKVSPREGKVPLTVELSGLPNDVSQKIAGCKFATGTARTNGITVDWGDGSRSPSATGTVGDSCVNDIKKHTYTKTGTFTVTVESTRGTSTRRDGTWKGTAQVTVRATSTPIACTMDARRCSDGSYVGRTGPRCEFVCPTASSSSSTVSLKMPAAQKARTALAKKLDVFTGSINVTSVVSRQWSDGCLGLGGAAESCAAVVTPGYRVTMTKASSTYYARTNKNGSTVRFEQ